jgi:stage II sporulation protein D
VALAAVAGVVLAGVTLVAWSCHGPTRSVSLGGLTAARAPSAVDVTPAAHASIRDEPLIRVRVERDAQRVALSTAGEWVVAPSGALAGELLSGPLTVVASNRGIKVIDARGRLSGFAPGEPVFAAPRLALDGAGVVSIDGRKYPGTLRLVPSDEPTRFDVVNVVDLERYLPGVISRELYSHWHEPTFQVQAVAARTFALSRREQARRAGRHYDVESGASDQVYGGVTTLDVAIRSVETTRGVVLIDRDAIAPAYYSSTCGGRPATASEIWPSAGAAVTTVSTLDPGDAIATPGREVLCQQAPLYRWKLTRRTTDLSRGIAAWGRANRHDDAANIGTLVRAEPVGFAASGRPLLYRLTDRDGTVAELTGEQLRLACNTAAEGRLDDRDRVHSNDLRLDVGPSATQIQGQGHGHGVGLCQFCAEGMALRGDTWREMLAAFYPGLEARRVY